MPLPDGFRHSQETKDKISKSKKGKKRPEITGSKHPLFGKHHTIEAREKIRVAKIGKVPWNKGKKGVTKAWNKGKRMSSELRKRFCGENHWNWKGGISSESKRIRKSLEYRLWREAVFKRDFFTCVFCGVKNGDGKAIVLHADHIKPFSLFPELRFSIDNGRTLCVSCHKKTETYGVRKC